MTRLYCEHLETRENPVGPVIVDPIGIPVTEAPPAATAPIVTEAPAPDITVIDKLIQQTIDAISSGY